MKRSQVSGALPLIAVAISITLLANPFTWLLARAQLEDELPLQVGLRARESGVRDIRTAAARAPHDYALQVTNALAGADWIGKVSRLGALRSEFPARPGLIAQNLGLTTIKDVQLNRAEEHPARLMAVTRNGRFIRSVTPTGRFAPDPAALPVFDRDAENGEHLDPSNAFFPLMHAVGLMASRHDGAALAEIHRAAALTDFNDYPAETCAAALSVEERLHGRAVLLRCMALPGVHVFPPYGDLRAVAGIAAGKALALENAGQVEAGMRVRTDFIRCGALMRDRSRTAAGTLMGISIVRIGMNRSGGPYYLADLPTAPGDRNDLCTFLARSGLATHIPAIRAETQANAQVQDALRRGPFAQYDAALHRTILPRWQADLLVLANALGMLLLGIVAAVLIRLHLDKAPWPAVVVGAALLGFASLSPIPESYMDLTMERLYSASVGAIHHTIPSNPIEALFAAASSPIFVRLAALVAILIGPAAILLASGGRLRGGASPTEFAHRLRTTGLVGGSATLLLYAILLIGTARAELGVRRAIDQATAPTRVSAALPRRQPGRQYLAAPDPSGSRRCWNALSTGARRSYQLPRGPAIAFASAARPFSH